MHRLIKLTKRVIVSIYFPTVQYSTMHILPLDQHFITIKCSETNLNLREINQILNLRHILHKEKILVCFFMFVKTVRWM